MGLLDLETNREKREDGEGGRRRGCLKGWALATAGTPLSLGGLEGTSAGPWVSVFSTGTDVPI